MANHSQFGNEHALPQSKSSGLCNDRFHEQANGSSYVLDTLGDFGSGRVSPPQNFDLFSPNYSVSFIGTGIEDIVPAANRNCEFWPPADVPSSLASSLIAS